MKKINKKILNQAVRFAHPLRDRLTASPVAQNDRQEGRSMVEMLGTLAVMGVLSVTAISGFSIAMNKYKANQIIAAASTLYMMSAASQSINPSGSSYGNIQPEIAYGDVKVSVDKDTWNKMNVEGATSDVCEIVESSFGSSQEFTINCPTEIEEEEED